MLPSLNSASNLHSPLGSTAVVASWNSYCPCPAGKCMLWSMNRTMTSSAVSESIALKSNGSVAPVSPIRYFLSCDVYMHIFFWKAYLSIKQPLTAHDPIHPRVSSRHDPTCTSGFIASRSVGSRRVTVCRMVSTETTWNGPLQHGPSFSTESRK